MIKPFETKNIKVYNSSNSFEQVNENDSYIINKTLSIQKSNNIDSMFEFVFNMSSD